MPDSRFIQAIVRGFRRCLTAGVIVLALASSQLARSDESTEPASFSAAQRAHWAFQPIRAVSLPQTRKVNWAKTPIDTFILAAMEKRAVTPAPAATKDRLLRRVTFDLIGMPPSWRELKQYLEDNSPDAYERAVDRLLASPHYGERWGRHWLDLARFGETDGFEHDTVRTNAWRYRDYVIRSFNADKPYDVFIREQLAGDILQERAPEALTATGFNLMGPDMVDSADQVQRRLNTLNDMTDTAGAVFLGLTVGCARCHDHKFEPITQRDYYRLQAYFTSAQFKRDREAVSPSDRASHESQLKSYRSAIEPLRRDLAVLHAPYRAQLREEKLAGLPAETRQALETTEADRTPAQRKLADHQQARIAVTEADVVKALSEVDRDKMKALQAQLAAAPQPAPLTTVLALSAGPPTTTHLLIRGDYNRPGEMISPGVPEILGRTPQPGVDRGGLANWIASTKNPLTARVMANRIWQHHFGHGLVRTPSDFGLSGERPSHPELLDWLAAEFIRGGWSIKQLQRQILLSAAYQQSAEPFASALTSDPGNELFSRRVRVRLEGEPIRDALLAISGQLNSEMGGEGVYPPIPAELFKGAGGWNPSPKLSEHARRSIYIFCRRNLRFPFLEVFDAPDNNLSCPTRLASTTAPQALSLLNASEVMAAAQQTAQRLQAHSSQPQEQIVYLYQLALSRSPSEKEQRHCEEFLRTSPLPELCRAVFNLNAFVYLD